MEHLFIGEKMSEILRTILGWIAVFISLLVSSFWSWWGIIENFHEGWYFQNILRNIGLMLVYLLPAIITAGLAIAAVIWPHAGGALHSAIGVIIVVWWQWEQWPPSTKSIIHIAPISGIVIMSVGLAYWFGSPIPTKLALGVIAGCPLLVVFIFGIGPAWRVMCRTNDRDLGERIIQTGVQQIVWAPRGPGWPAEGSVDWETAMDIVGRLNDQGTALEDKPTGCWRLPSVEQVVICLTRNGKNSEGTWNANQKTAHYQRIPDKETPLWDPCSKVIYWWTRDEIGSDHDSAWVVVYNGRVVSRLKKMKMPSLGFRAMRGGNGP